MSQKLLALSGSLFSIVFIVIVIGSYVIVAQNTVTGEWRADVRGDAEREPGTIQFNFERRSTSGGHNNQTGFGIRLEDLQGLTRDQLQGGKVTFRLVREAGTIDFDGSFNEGRGSGTFRFVGNQAFLDAMRSRGFDFERSRHGNNIEDRQFTAAILNVTSTTADDLSNAGLGRLDVDDLFKAVIFKVDSRFISEMKATGFPNLTMEDLVKARIFKIDAEYVRQVHDMGFANSDFEDLVKFRIFKVTPQYLTELKAAGLNELSAEEVVKFRIFKIDPEFIRAEKARDPNVTAEDLVRMKIGVHRSRDDN